MLIWAQHGAREGDWIFADQQTEGRGRQGGAWQSPKGNLYGSTLVRLRDGDPPALTLSLVAALAVHHWLRIMVRQDIREREDERWIKWPNDVLITRKKIAGVLLERHDNMIIVGFGVNLVIAPSIPERETVSLQQVEREPMNFFMDGVHSTFAGAWVKQLWIWRDRQKGGLPAIRERWLRYAHDVGTPLSVGLPDGERLSGCFDGLTEDCALRLALADGSVRVIHAGDVFLI